MPVTSGVPQGSVLQPVLFIIYINDLGFSNVINKFADDAKIGDAALLEQNRRSLQEDLRNLSDWSGKWKMPCNINNKCQILQIGSKNRKMDYKMCNVMLNSNQLVKNLGVTVSSNLKFPQQCNEAVKKENRKLV